LALLNCKEDEEKDMKRKGENELKKERTK